MSLGDLFGGGDDRPQPAPLPVSPSADAGAEQARAKAAQDAEIESASNGRRSTMVAGMKIAQDEQAGTGLLAQKKRAAAKDMGY